MVAPIPQAPQHALLGVLWMHLHTAAPFMAISNRYVCQTIGPHTARRVLQKSQITTGSVISRQRQTRHNALPFGV